MQGDWRDAGESGLTLKLCLGSLFHNTFSYKMEKFSLI